MGVTPQKSLMTFGGPYEISGIEHGSAAHKVNVLTAVLFPVPVPVVFWSAECIFKQ